MVVYVPFIYVVPFEREITAQLVEEELFDNGFITGQSIHVEYSTWGIHSDPNFERLSSTTPMLKVADFCVAVILTSFGAQYIFPFSIVIITTIRVLLRLVCVCMSFYFCFSVIRAIYSGGG